VWGLGFDGQGLVVGERGLESISRGGRGFVKRPIR